MPKFVRVATEGATIDGREISGEHLEQMAKNYDPEKYGARIWLEHFRTYMPEGPFQAYGDVKALKTEKKDGKTVLMAELEPTPALIELNKKRQKIFTSVEIQPNFAKTGEAYLTGIAITDSPASTGTEALKFSLGQDKGADAKLVSEYTELDQAFSEDAPEDPKADSKFLDKIKGMFSRSETTEKESREAITTVAEQVANLTGDFTSQADSVVKLTKAVETLATGIDQIQSDFKSFKSQVEKTPGGQERPEVTGREDDGDVTDC